MSLQQAPGNRYGDINVNDGGTVHAGDQYISLQQDVILECSRRERSRRKRLLESLRFPEMNDRRNRISGTRYNTFEWALDRGNDPGSLKTHLVTWLQNDQDTFLIQGKAGSGKSTFMKFLFDHKKTTQYLLQRPERPKPFLLFHSFWLMGTKLQYDFKGFLASLTYQILANAAKDFCQLCCDLDEDCKDSLNDWSESDLRRILFDLIESCQHTLCFFVDGLDEFDHEDHIEKVYDFMNDVKASCTQCKFCLSTRPISHILDYFKFVPALRLQDLTENDIHAYVKQNLEEKARLVPQDVQKLTNMREITNIICEKADGVFLWVRYALNNARSGICIGDDLDTLRRRISKMPSKIEDLYQHMWNLQNDDNAVHANEASMLFSFGRHFPMPLFQLVVALEPKLINHYMDNATVLDEEYLRALCEKKCRWLRDRSAGLIECIEEDDGMDVMAMTRLPGTKTLCGAGPILRSPWRRSKVRYMHRTVGDFLEQNEDGRLISGHQNKSLSAGEVDRKWIQSYLACFVEDVIGFTPQGVSDLVHQNVWRCQHQYQLIDIADNFCKRLVAARTGNSRFQGDNWFFLLFAKHREYTNLPRFKTCFPDLVANISPTCTQHLLTNRGTNWTPYYKGYLALCASKQFVWRCTGREDDATNMFNILEQLKHAGADFTSPHPHFPRDFLMAIHSPASYLLTELCTTILRHKWAAIKLEHVYDILTVLDGLDLSGQKLTLRWDLHCRTGLESLDGFLTYDAGDIHALLAKLSKSWPPHWESLHKCNDFVSSSKLLCRKRFAHAFMMLPCKVHVRAGSKGYWERQHDLPARCSATESYWVTRVAFGIEDSKALEDIAFPGSILFPPDIPDLDFRADWETIKPLLRPLDPHTEINAHNWKTKGMLREYYALTTDYQNHAVVSSGIDPSIQVADREEVLPPTKTYSQATMVHSLKRRSSTEASQSNKRRA